MKLVPPLFDKISGSGDQAPLKAPLDRKLLDQEPRHHRLARARIVGQQEPGHRVVDRGQLVRERFDVRSVHRCVGIERVHKPDPERLRGQPA